MATDRLRILLAVLRAHGPAHPADLAYHPILREHYRLLGRFEIRDDLEELSESGEVVSYEMEVDGEPATVAYDIAGMDRENRDPRIERAKKVVRKHRRRKARHKL